MEQSLAGQLLLASPALLDPSFVRTVVLVGVHNDEGAVGLVLNRPSEVTVGDAVPQLCDAVGDLAPVYVGGPVKPESIVMLIEFSHPSSTGLLVLDGIGFPGADTSIEDLAELTQRGRVYAGYAGWGGGQLDAEVADGDWILHDPVPEDVFTEEPGQLWSSVLTRMGGSYALLARMPLDPSLN